MGAMSNCPSSARARFAVAVCLLISAALVTPSGPRAAAVAAFDSLAAGLAYASATGRPEYSDYWQSGQGVEAFLNTPFYWGKVHVGVRYLRNTGDTPSLDYDSAFMYAGWSAHVRLPRSLSLEPGLSCGGTVMSFDTDPESGNQLETEVAVELFVRLAIPVHGRWQLAAVAGWNTILTYNRIDLAVFSIGVSRELSMPGWMRGFLE